MLLLLLLLLSLLKQPQLTLMTDAVVTC